MRGLPEEARAPHRRILLPQLPHAFPQQLSVGFRRPLHALPERRARFDEAFCYGAYEGTLRKLIHLFKYSGMRRLAKPLAALLADALPRDRQFDLVTPVPLHWLRRWHRGYQSGRVIRQGHRPGAWDSDCQYICAAEDRHAGAGGTEQCAAPRECGGRFSRPPQGAGIADSAG